MSSPLHENDQQLVALRRMSLSEIDSEIGRLFERRASAEKRGDKCTVATITFELDYADNCRATAQASDMKDILRAGTDTPSPSIDGPAPQRL